MIALIPLIPFSFYFGCSSFLLHNQALPLLAIGDYASSAKHLLIGHHN
jgi:hypothetical protein